MSLLDVIPGLREAQAKEKELREREALAFGGELCGVEVRTLTVRDWLVLSAIRTPFLCGGFIRRSDCLRLLVYMSAGYRPSGFRAFINKHSIIARLKKWKTEDMIAEIEDWFSEVVLLDASGGGGTGEEPDYCTYASILNSLGMSYGWTPEVIDKLPMAMVMQLSKARADYNGHKRIKWSRLSDRVRAEFLKARFAQ